MFEIITAATVVSPDVCSRLDMCLKLITDWHYIYFTDMLVNDNVLVT